MKKILSVLLCLTVFFTFAACSPAYKPAEIKAEDLMKNIAAQPTTGAEIDDVFINAAADFSINLFKETVDGGKNSLISPLSVMLALAMTANGADNNTLTEMETVLGGLPTEELNKYLYTYANSLPSEKKSVLETANSIWFKDGVFNVNPEFLQANADYYGAAAYKSAFDGQTVTDINNWVKNNTKGLIDKIIDEITEDNIMFLINTVLFDAEWLAVYKKENVSSNTFTAFDGKEQSVKFMRSEEYKYLEDGESAIGVIKPYFGNHYSFAALLPSEGVSINEYIASLTGERFIDVIKNAERIRTITSIPKFKYDYEISMVDALMKMGMTEAFDDFGADFTKMGNAVGYDNVYIGDVLHKTYISVDELGTKAGAVTSVAIGPTSSEPSAYKIVNLNRPFVYALIDNATGLPAFIGTVLKV